MIGLSVMSPRSIEENIFTIELNVERGRYDRSTGRRMFLQSKWDIFLSTIGRGRYFYGPILPSTA